MAKSLNYTKANILYGKSKGTFLNELNKIFLINMIFCLTLHFIFDFKLFQFIEFIIIKVYQIYIISIFCLIIILSDEPSKT
jgi:hypothetical protein